MLLLYLLLGEILDLVVGLATPIADLFPKGTFDKLTAPFPIAVTLLVGVSFLIGLALRLEVGRRLGGWIDRNVLGRLPLYSALKSLTKAFREAGEGAAFRPALLGSSEGVREVIYVVEDQDTGAQSFRYVRTATNHYSLAFTYDCVAWSRDGWVDLSQCGWMGYDEDDHWRSSIRFADF